jgi:transposase
LLNAILDGEVITSKDLDRLVKGRLQPKIPVLAEAINGNLREHHRFMLRSFLLRLNSLDQQIAMVESRIADLVKPYEKQLELLDTIPGVDRIVAIEIIAEVGADMSVFPSDRHIIMGWHRGRAERQRFAAHTLDDINCWQDDELLSQHFD